MCRFTLAIDQQNVNVQCFSLNVSKSGSLRLVGKRQKILRVLPTIVETQEDGKEFPSEEREKCTKDAQSLVSEFSEFSEWEWAKESQVCKFNSANYKSESQFNTASYFTKGSKQPSNHKNQSSSQTGVIKTSQESARFQGFGDFFPRDFVKNFDHNVPAEIGIKNYLEKKTEQFKKMNCREEEMREYNKSRGAEIQSWLHFFG